MKGLADRLKEILGLNREPVGVKFLDEKGRSDLKNKYDSETKTRYCQALMRAGKGENIIITKDNVSCPASAAAFGIKPLPEMLQTGQMLLNMGLFESLEAGKKAMDGMTRLEQGKYQAVLLSPLDSIEIEPDVVVIESKPEHLMWTALAYIFKTGDRLSFSSAIFQATCVDSTVIPFAKDTINSSLGCYGCRDATDIEDSECLIGLPYKKLEEVIDNLEKLSEKAMKKTRVKEAFHSFSGCGE
jgi:Uncharacterized protein conserved in archaea